MLARISYVLGLTVVLFGSLSVNAAALPGGGLSPMNCPPSKFWATDKAKAAAAANFLPTSLPHAYIIQSKPWDQANFNVAVLAAKNNGFDTTTLAKTYLPDFGLGLGPSGNPSIAALGQEPKANAAIQGFGASGITAGVAGPKLKPVVAMTTPAPSVPQVAAIASVPLAAAAARADAVPGFAIVGPVIVKL
ncbi:hypothetical protein HDU96_008432 [Phlyctochytrium bullatum]|nr:hypothetical protein HDU96_008432 [Phlyctochytrium bullatum]